jgi:tetratricopeptide (TPR) repeat protein
LGLSNYYLGLYDEAIPWFEKKIELQPDIYNTYLNLAYCYLKKGDNETAIDKMVRVTELNPDYCNAYQTIAGTYLISLKQPAASVEWYQKWADCDTTAYEPYKWLGYISVSAKPVKRDQAIRYLLKCTQMMRKAGVNLCEEIDVLIWLMQVYNMYDEIEKEEKALDWAREVLKCDPDNKDAKNVIEQLE